jgi:hypothetical protein
MAGRDLTLDFPEHPSPQNFPKSSEQYRRGWADACEYVLESIRTGVPVDQIQIVLDVVVSQQDQERGRRGPQLRNVGRRRGPDGRYLSPAEGSD